MYKIRVRNVYLLLCKTLVFFLYFYLTWYKEIWGNSPIALYGLSIFLTCLVAYGLLQKRRINLNKIAGVVRFYFLFCIYNALSGMMVAGDKSHLISSIVTLFAFSVVCFDCWFIIEQEGDAIWLLKIFLSAGLICAVFTIFFGKPYYNGIIVTTMSRLNNPNTLGLVLQLAIFSIVLLYEKKKKHFLISICLVAFLSYAIVLSGSRKMFISNALFLTATIVWLCFSKQNQVDLEKQIRYVFIIGVVLFVLWRLRSSFATTTMAIRLQALLSEGMNSIRAKLYEEALQIWKSHPLFGIGYNQYISYSAYNLYTHSTYAETLACCGVVGLLLLLRSLFQLGKDILRFHKGTKQGALLFAVFFVELFIFTAQIYYYDLVHMLLLLYISAVVQPQRVDE